MSNKLLWIGCAVLTVVLLMVLAIVLFVWLSGKPVPAPIIPREQQTLGSGPAKTYVVMGDSTAIGQGAAYKDSYAVATAQYLAKSYTVTFSNTGVSAARAKDVLENQVAKAVELKPDIVLLAVGANDAKNFTSGSRYTDAMLQIVTKLKAANCTVQIIVTGSPAMDSVSRFPIGAKQVMALRTKQINTALQPVLAKDYVHFAPIAEKTRQVFLDDHSLTAADKFHPNARGYALWTPVITEVMDSILERSDNPACN